MITQEQQAQLDALLGNQQKVGNDWYAQVQKRKQETQVEQPVEEEQGFFKEAVAPYMEKQKETREAFQTGEQGFVSSLFQTGGNVIGAALSPLTSGIAKGVSALAGKAPESVKDVAGSVAKPVAGVFDYLVDNISDAGAIQKFAMSDEGKTFERNIEAGLEYLAVAPVGKVVKPVGGALGSLAEKQAIKGAEKAGTKIASQFEKGVRPSLTGSKRTVAGMDRYMNQAKQAIGSIVKNKETLNFVDDFGETISGKLPTNLKEFSQAVQQTKQSIYNKYSALAGQTTKGGVQVQMNKIASELDKVANSNVLKGFRPEVVSYAQSRAEALKAMGALSPDDVQEAIKIMNQSLDAFYKSPSFDTASKAWIDSLIVNNLRNELDDVITKTTGAEYQALKNEYAALRAIEQDVAHRALVDARKNAKGLLDFTDVLSGGEVVSGLVSMNPALFAKGVAQKGIASYMKALNDPNNIIRKMFESAEKAQGRIRQIQRTPIDLNKKTPQSSKVNMQGGSVANPLYRDNAKELISKRESELFLARENFKKGTGTQNDIKAAQRNLKEAQNLLKDSGANNK